MKKLLKRSLIIIYLPLILVSCKKASSPVPPVSFTPYLKGKIDGRAFNVTANSLYAIGTTAGSELVMGGHFESDGSISIHLKNFNNSTGERQINETNYIAIDTLAGILYYAGSIIPGTPVQGNGKITILSVTEKEVKGTFEGVLLVEPSQNSGQSPLNVTEGEFHLKRQ